MRRRNILFFLMSLALLALPLGSALAAGWSFGVTGGTGLPTGDFADENKGNAKTGFQVGGLVDYAINDMFRVGLDGSYVQNKNDFEDQTVPVTDLSVFDPSASGPGDVTFDKFKYNTWQVGAHGKYMFPMQSSPLAPYAIVGLGVYNTTAKADWTVPSTGNSFTDNEAKFETRFGGKLGLGAVWKASPVIGVGAEVNYNFISEDKDKAGFDSAQYVDIHGGVTFSIPMAAK
jgi:opacity protein-like surface antigen